MAGHVDATYPTFLATTNCSTGEHLNQEPFICRRRAERDLNPLKEIQRTSSNSGEWLHFKLVTCGD